MTYTSMKAPCGNWVHQYRVEHVDDEPALSVSERARLLGCVNWNEKVASCG